MEPKIISEPILHEVVIRADRDEVFRALATADGLNGWFTSESVIEPRSGGELSLHWRNWGPDGIDEQDHGKVVEYRPPERFVFQWGSPATTVSFDLTPEDGRTRVRVHEQGYPDTPESRRQMLECATGWGEALTLLKFFLEHGLKYER